MPTLICYPRRGQWRLLDICNADGFWFDSPQAAQDFIEAHHAGEVVDWRGKL